MIIQDFELNGATFRIWTYKQGEKMADFTHSFHSPAIDHEDYTIAYWMDGKHFAAFEGIVFCAAQTELYPELDTVAEVKRQIERIMRERVPSPAQTAHELRLKLEASLREISAAPFPPTIQEALASIEQQTVRELTEKQGILSRTNIG